MSATLAFLRPIGVRERAGEPVRTGPATTQVGRAGGPKTSARWSASGSAPLAPHKDAGGNVLFNDGHVAWANSLPSTAGTNDSPNGSVLVAEP